MRYVRKEFDLCKLIIQEDLTKSKGCNEYANYVLGMIFQHEGKVREALECFQKCCFLNPGRIPNICQLGKCWFLLGQKYQAIESFSKAEKLVATPNWNIYHNLGVCYVSLGRIGKAREYLTKAVHLGRTLQSYDALARLYIAENDINSALEVYHIALELFPSSWELATDLGQLYLQVGETAKAFNSFGLALAINRESMQALLAVASICQEEKEYEVALSKYKIAGQYLPESICLWNNMGLCFFGKGKYVAAIGCLKRANYLDPMDWKTLFNLGLVHIHTKQYTSAFHFLSSAIKLENRHALSFMLLGIVLQRMSHHENATKCFEQAIKLDVDDVNIRINYISHLYAQDKKEAALEHLNVVQRLMQQIEVDDKTKEAVRQLTQGLTQGLLVNDQLDS
ncbi:Bardet-Biedl syndrome 4 protein isoform X2 [Cimex lectularius]|nr:Bardet-Biedl syndrome 4 protein isoform X2 [Cimex lectularius]XP_014244923.1 Bardet-Biedl syndrome 4 protein isoform X2 [Cimex lectularius]